MLPDGLRALLDRRGPWLAGCLWLSVYAIIVVTGQPFLVGYLDYGWQLVPWDILVSDPLGSVWNLHSQPPLWNLVLGVLARLSPFSDAATLQALQCAIGALLAGVMVAVVRRLRVPSLPAIIVALVVTLNPEVLRNAFEPTYELAVSLLLASAVLFIQRLIESARPLDLIGLSMALTSLVLTRSLYHPVVIVVLLGAASWAVRRSISRRTMALAALLPLVLVGGWMLKNELMFGRATLSSWFGMNLQRSTIPILPRDDLEAMHAAGDVSDVALIGPFGNYATYRDVMPPCTPSRRHPALTEEGHLAADGVIIPNFNFECFLPVYDQAASDFWAVATSHPEVWLEGRWFSLKMTFATSNLATNSNSLPFRALGQAYKLLRVDVILIASTVGWGSPIYGEFTLPFRFSLAVLLIYATSAMAAAIALVPRWRRRLDRTAAARAAIMATGFLGAFTVVVGIVGELGEQARFRSMTDPVVLAVGGVLLVRLLHRCIRGTPAPGGGGGRAAPASLSGSSRARDSG